MTHSNLHKKNLPFIASTHLKIKTQVVLYYYQTGLVCCAFGSILHTLMQELPLKVDYFKDF